MGYGESMFWDSFFEILKTMPKHEIRELKADVDEAYTNRMIKVTYVKH